MRRIALTGGIATGKSHVLAEFAQFGVPTIDADRLARDVVAAGTPGLKAIVDRFGSAVLDHNGVLDRRKLGTIVFADPIARRDLEAIVHPAVVQAIDAWFESLADTPPGFAIADIPLLYETGRHSEFDAVIVTACDPATQLTRIVGRDGITEAEARARIAAQLPLGEKAARANYVINTDASFEQTKRQVGAVYEALVGG
jgi:dephospho-CoA kinase